MPSHARYDEVVRGQMAGIFLNRAKVIIPVGLLALLVNFITPTQAATYQGVRLHPSGAASGDQMKDYEGASPAAALDSNDGDRTIGKIDDKDGQTARLELDDTSKSGTILSVQVSAALRSKDDDEEDVALRIGLRSQGREYFGPVLSNIGKRYRIYPGPTFTANPSTGIAWTWDEVNSLVALVRNENGEAEYRITELYAEVVYLLEEPSAPVITPMVDQTMAEGTLRTLPLSATDADGDSLRLSASGLPIFATLVDNGDGTGRLQLAPGIGDAGSYSVTVAVRDDGNPALSDSQSFSILVNAANRAPVLDLVSNQTLTAGTGDSVSLSATDADGDSLRFSASGLPSFAVLVDNGNGTGRLQLAPGIGDAGSYSVTVAVRDNGNPALSDSRSFSILVNAANRAPALAFVSNQTLTAGTGDSVSLSATDADSDSLRFSANGLPTFATLVDNGNGTGSLQLTPGIGDAGRYSVTVAVRDNGNPSLSDSQSFSILVDAANRAPVLGVVSNHTLTAGTSGTVPLSATDADGDKLRFSVDDPPAFAILVDNGNGTGRLQFAPGIGDAGSYSMTVMVRDDANSSLSDSKVFVIQVNPQAVTDNGSPVAIADSVTTALDVPVTIDVLANDRGLDDAPITVSLRGGPSNGTALVQPDKTITYAPGNGYVGADSFGYEVTDANGDIAMASVSISIECSNCRSVTPPETSVPPNSPPPYSESILYRSDLASATSLQELLSIGWKTTLPPVELTDATTEAGVYLTILNGVAQQKVLELRSASPRNLAITTPFVHVEPNTKIIVSGILKLEDVAHGSKGWYSARLRVESFDSNGIAIPGSSIPFGKNYGTRDWAEYALETVTPPNTDAVRIWAELKEVTGTVYVDQLSIKVTNYDTVVRDTIASLSEANVSTQVPTLVPTPWRISSNGTPIVFNELNLVNATAVDPKSQNELNDLANSLNVNISTGSNPNIRSANIIIGSPQDALIDQYLKTYEIVVDWNELGDQGYVLLTKRDSDNDLPLWQSLIDQHLKHVVSRFPTYNGGLKEPLSKQLVNGVFLDYRLGFAQKN